MIKTGFCISYDWEFLRTSLPRVYEFSDVICLGLDRYRMSWAMQPFEFNMEEFQSFVRSIDVDSKIDIYEDEFSIEGLNSRENGNRHRTMIANRMGAGGWHLQVDADEYFLDFKGFTEFLKLINPNPTGDEHPCNVCANWIPLFKKLDGGYLYVDFKDRMPEVTPVATTRPNYERARHNGFFNKMSPYYMIHETWARTEKQLWFKLNNWGHSAEELEAEAARKEYFDKWKNLNESNYHIAKNIHPAKPEEWPALSYLPGKNIDEFLENFDPPEFPLSSAQLRIQNNRNVARVKHLFKRVLRQ